MKKVLVISYSFPPANSPAAKRAFYFVKYLPEFKIQPFVLTSPNQISSLGYGSSLNDSAICFIDSPPSVNKSQRTSKDVVKPGIVTSILRHLLFPDRGIVWAPRAFKKAFQFLRTKKDIDFIFATAPSFVNVLLALLLSVFFRKKMVIDFRDFYFTKGLFKRFFLFRWLDFLLEFFAMKKASAIVFISKGMLNAYVKRYPFIKPKASIIYNGIDLQNYNASVNLTKSYSESQPLKLFYAGSLYLNSSHPRDIFRILNLFEELHQLKKIPDYEFHIASNLTPLELLRFEPYIATGKVKLLGVLSQEEVEKYYNKVDACLLLLGNSDQDQFAVPIKVFEYLVTGLPILSLTPAQAEVLELLSNSDLYANCKYSVSDSTENTKTIIDWFVKLKSLNRQAPDSNLLNKFDRKEQTKELANLMNLLCD